MKIFKPLWYSLLYLSIIRLRSELVDTHVAVGFFQAAFYQVVFLVELFGFRDGFLDLLKVLSVEPFWLSVVIGKAAALPCGRAVLVV